MLAFVTQLLCLFIALMGRSSTSRGEDATSSIDSERTIHYEPLWTQQLLRDTKNFAALDVVETGGKASHEAQGKGVAFHAASNTLFYTGHHTLLAPDITTHRSSVLVGAINADSGRQHWLHTYSHSFTTNNGGKGTHFKSHGGESFGRAMCIDSTRDALFVVAQSTITLNKHRSSNRGSLFADENRRTGRSADDEKSTPSMILDVGGYDTVVGKFSISFSSQLNDVKDDAGEVDLQLDWEEVAGGESGLDVPYDISCDSAPDSNSGGVYITGMSAGSMHGAQFNGGAYDMFLIKYAADRDYHEQPRLWTILYGSEGVECGHAVAADPTGSYVFVAGQTNHELGSPGSYAGRYDAVLVKFDAVTGEHLWSYQVGSPKSDCASGIDIHPGLGSVFLTGFTGGNLFDERNVGRNDAFIVRLTIDEGILQWGKLYGGEGDDYFNSIALAKSMVLHKDDDQSGRDILYLVGETKSKSIFGSASKGQSDAFLICVNAENGAVLSAALLGSTDRDGPHDLVVDQESHAIYMTGYTGGLLSAENSDTSSAHTRHMGPDAFVSRINALTGDRGEL